MTSSKSGLTYNPIDKETRTTFRMQSIPVGYHMKLKAHEEITWMVYDNLEEVKLSLDMWFDEIDMWFDDL